MQPSLIEQLTVALAEHRAGRLAPAEAGYRAVLLAAPEQSLALHLLGVLTLATGRAAEAVGLLRAALPERSNNDETRLALADALAASGARAEAIAAYRALLADRPDHLPALVNLANALRDEGAYPDAIAACERAVALAPGLAPAWATLGSARLAAGQHAAAVTAYREAVALRPDFAPACAGLAAALLRSDQAEAALDAAMRAIGLARGLAEAWFVRGAALRALRRFAAAGEALRQAVRLEPLHARAHLALGNAEFDLDRPAPAEWHLRRALALDPGLPEAQVSLGFLLESAGRLDEAIAAYDEAIRLRPDFAAAHWNRGFAHLLRGDFGPGWEDYEWRRRHERFAGEFPPRPGRRWEGETLEGHTLLVQAEQGFGDTIQFARYLPLLAARGANVVLACAAPLVSLLDRLPGVTAVAKTGALPPCDLWVDQMSLPRLFGTRIDSIPFPQAYLTADSAGIGPARRPRVGIVWAGNPLHSNDRLRSMPGDALAPILAVPEIDWVNLQVGTRSGELAGRFGIADMSRQFPDFAATAILVATLDLVISVDTCVAHLAGALGRPVWVMLPFAPDWRWMTGRCDSPWYSSMRLFRQDRPGGWDGVAERVAASLAGLFTPPHQPRHRAPAGVESRGGRY